MWNMNLELAPKRGLILAYLPGQLVFAPYEMADGRPSFVGCASVTDATPVECHLFDADTEYRMVWRESRGDAVEVVLTRDEEDALDADLVYAEEPLVKGEWASQPDIPDRIRVVNRYAYTENDTLVLRNYRMALPEVDGA